MPGLLLVRRIAGFALAVAAGLVWVLMAPEDPHTSDYGSARDSIASNDDANNVMASGAPQQTVVNGWTSNDYLDLMSEQLDALAQPDRVDRRPGILLLIASLGLAVLLVTSGQPTERHGTAAPPMPPPYVPPTSA